MNNQESGSEASNKINGYISWDSYAPSLSDKITADSNEDDETYTTSIQVQTFSFEKGNKKSILNVEMALYLIKCGKILFQDHEIELI